MRERAGENLNPQMAERDTLWPGVCLIRYIRWGCVRSPNPPTLVCPKSNQQSGHRLGVPGLRIKYFLLSAENIRGAFFFFFLKGKKVSWCQNITAMSLDCFQEFQRRDTGREGGLA